MKKLLCIFASALLLIVLGCEVNVNENDLQNPPATENPEEDKDAWDSNTGYNKVLEFKL